MNGQNAAAARAVGTMLLSSAEVVADPPSGSEAAQRTGLPTTEIPPVNEGASDSQTRDVRRIASVEIIRSNRHPCRARRRTKFPERNIWHRTTQKEIFQ